MKRLIVFALVAAVASAATIGVVRYAGRLVEKPIVLNLPAPRGVALVVQNHSNGTAPLPMSAFASALTAHLSRSDFGIINPHNVIGAEQNRMAGAEEKAMPEASAVNVGRMLNAAGVLTATVLQFTSESLGVPPKGYALKTRLALSLSDSATGEAVCGYEGVVSSDNYTVEQMKEDGATLYEKLLCDAAAECASKFLAKLDASGWRPAAPPLAAVRLSCNIPGADVKIDGVAAGTMPLYVKVPQGVHNLVVEYPFCIPYSTKAVFADGQKFDIRLQLDDKGRERFKSETLFAETLERIRKTSETDDLVRRTLLEGVKDDAEKKDGGGLLRDIIRGDSSSLKADPSVQTLMDKAKNL